MPVIKCQENFRIFQFASAIIGKKLPKTQQISADYVGKGFSIPQYFAKGYDLVF